MTGVCARHQRWLGVAIKAGAQHRFAAVCGKRGGFDGAEGSGSSQELKEFRTRDTRMQIILQEDIEKLGHRGERGSRKTGIRANYLLPRSLAIEATPGNMKRSSGFALAGEKDGD